MGREAEIDGEPSLPARVAQRRYEMAESLADHRRRRRLDQQRMGGAAMGQVAVGGGVHRQQIVEVWQRPQHPAYQRRPAGADAPAEHGESDGGAESELRYRIHGRTENWKLSPIRESGLPMPPEPPIMRASRSRFTHERACYVRSGPFPL